MISDLVLLACLRADLEVGHKKTAHWHGHDASLVHTALLVLLGLAVLVLLIMCMPGCVVLMRYTTRTPTR